MTKPTLIPDPNNANRGTQRGEGQLERSLQQYGAGRSILASSDGVILAGNKTYQKAQELGIPIREIESDGKTLFVIKRTDLNYDDPRAKELGIADNRTSELGLEWDADVLQAFMDDGIDLEQFWFPEEMEDVLAGEDDEPMGGNTDPDDIPDVPEEPTTKPGDLWLLGRHRLLCGDSTVVTDVDRLMDGTKADMVFTDPPYGVSYVGKTKDALTIENDSLGDDGTRALVRDALAIAPLKPGGAFYVCSPPGNTETAFRLAIAEAGHELRQCLVWVKQQFVMGRQDYHWRHESILYGWADGAAHYFVDDRTQDTVWEIDRPHRNADHPTMKPVELIEKALQNSSKRGDIVLDLFGGSGSTLIACEQTGRDARLMELDPHYCDVIIRRWEDYTGETVTLITGDTPLS